MADAPKKKIIDILNEHGTGKGKDKSGVDDDKEDELRALSKMTDDSNGGPVPKELKPYVEKEAHMTPFEQGYWRTMKIAAGGGKKVVPGKAKFVDYDGTEKKNPKKPAPKKKSKTPDFSGLKYTNPFTTKKAEDYKLEGERKPTKTERALMKDQNRYENENTNSSLRLDELKNKADSPALRIAEGGRTLVMDQSIPSRGIIDRETSGTAKGQPTVFDQARQRRTRNYTGSGGQAYRSPHGGGVIPK